MLEGWTFDLLSAIMGGVVVAVFAAVATRIRPPKR